MNDKIIVEKVNEVFIKLKCDMSQTLEIRQYFTCYAPNFQFHPKFRAKIWDGKLCFYDYRTNTLPIGLLPKLAKFAKQFDYELDFQFDLSKMSNNISIDDLSDYLDKVFKDIDITPRDYQLDAIHKSLTNKRGIVLSPTGSGKSLIIYSMIRFLLGMNKKTMLVVPNISLVEQMYSDFKSYGWDNIDNHVTKLYNGVKPDFNKEILITTWQSIYKKQESFFKDYEALLIDETHQAKSLSIQTIAKKSVNAEYRIGLTGTLPTEDSDIFNIYGYLGPVIFKQKTKELQKLGVLSDISIVNLLLQYPEEMVKLNKQRPYVEEVETITTYANRNKVFKYIFDKIEDKQNSVVLCHKIEHLKAIEEYLLENLNDKYSVYVIYGAVKPVERERIRHLMDQEENLILLGTYATLSTGINIKKLHHVIFASSYKSKIKILQSIGRGLRTHETKEKMVLWDIVDDLRYTTRNGTKGKNHVYKHFEERLKFYNEQEFKFFNKDYKL